MQHNIIYYILARCSFSRVLRYPAVSYHSSKPYYINIMLPLRRLRTQGPLTLHCCKLSCRVSWKERGSGLPSLPGKVAGALEGHQDANKERMKHPNGFPRVFVEAEGFV